MSGELKGKVAVVTGAASGIGLASAEAMLALGVRVAMADRDADALNKLESRSAIIPASPAGINAESDSTAFVHLPRVYALGNRSRPAGSS